MDEVSAYAKEQGNVHITYVICTAAVAAMCGLEAGQARMVRHDLPPHLKHTGVRYRGKVEDVRQLHIFSRSSVLPVYSYAGDVDSLIHFNVATVPIMFILCDSKTLAAQLPPPRAMEELGWELMGRMTVLVMDIAFARRWVGLWSVLMPAATAEDAGVFPQVFVCKYLLSEVCYDMSFHTPLEDQLFNMKSDKSTVATVGIPGSAGEDLMVSQNQMQMGLLPLPGDGQGEGEGEEEEEEEDDEGLGVEIMLPCVTMDTVTSFANAYLDEDTPLTYIPRTSPHTDLHDRTCGQTPPR